MATKNKTQITKAKTANSKTVPSASKQRQDCLDDAKRVFDYLEEHPSVGFFASSAAAAGSVGAMIYYGRKMKWA